MSDVAHETAVVMEYIFEAPKKYSDIASKPDYLERAHTLPTFEPAKPSYRSSTEFTSDLYTKTEPTIFPQPKSNYDCNSCYQ